MNVPTVCPECQGPSYNGLFCSFKCVARRAAREPNDDTYFSLVAIARHLKRAG